MKSLLASARVAAPTLPGPSDDAERGDVPGWVLVTMMSAALVVVIWGFAGPALQTLFNQAIAKVAGL